ncbi:MAG: PAS domain-containing protein [Planctomycetaceae bacterium]|nr:PAS domain-containing protein [Planctomycetaceae bacterium]
MKSFCGCTFTAVFAFVLASASAVAWFVHLFVTPLTWSLGVGAFVAAMGAAIAAAVLSADRTRPVRDAFGRYLNELSQSDSHTFCDPSETPMPRQLERSSWREVADELRRMLTEMGNRVRELETTRSAQEIRSRRALDETERLRSILANLGDPVLVVNGYDEVSLANPAAESLFSFHLEGAEQRALAGLVRCQQLVDLLLTTNHRETSGRRTDEIEIHDDAGNVHWYRATACRLPLFREGKSAQETGGQGTVVVLRDVDREKTLQKRNAEFVSSVSHEMKTPLAGIKAYVELLADGDADDEETQEEFLNVIDTQADRLQRLVENLLNLARIEAGVVSVNKNHRSLNEILEEASQVVQPAAEAKSIKLCVELSPLYLGVYADRDMLLQSAINLLSNAVKYTQEGGKVTLRSRAVDDMIVYEVEDTGVGLSEEDSQRVFEKFYRVKKDKDMAQGTGLGLPLAKHIVEDVHGGTLSLESKLGVGSKFTAAFPTAGTMS